MGETVRPKGIKSMSEAATSRFDPIKWVLVLLLVAAGVVGNSYYSDESLLYRVLALLVLAAAAGWVASTTAKGGAFWNLIKGSRTEIRKVVWPTRQETTQTTMIVVVFVFVMALILWALDSLLGWAASLILG
jgi:preprotein translocase subunit SecE